MTLIIIVLIIVSGINLWQRLEIINYKYRHSIINDNVDKAIKKSSNVKDLEILYEIKAHLKYAK